MQVQGACHCGAVRFEVEWDAAFTYRCNCSLCKRKGALMGSAPKADFKLVSGAGALGLYQWNTGLAEHYFCTRCGIYTHHGRRTDPTQMGFNTGCLEGVDVSAIPRADVDGASLS